MGLDHILIEASSSLLINTIVWPYYYSCLFVIYHSSVHFGLQVCIFCVLHVIKWTMIWFAHYAVRMKYFYRYVYILGSVHFVWGMGRGGDLKILTIETFFHPPPYNASKCFILPLIRWSELEIWRTYLCLSML